MTKEEIGRGTEGVSQGWLRTSGIFRLFDRSSVAIDHGPGPFPAPACLQSDKVVAGCGLLQKANISSLSS